MPPPLAELVQVNKHLSLRILLDTLVTALKLQELVGRVIFGLLERIQ